MIQKYDYDVCFFVTACLQCIGLIVRMLLLPLVPVKEGAISSREGYESSMLSQGSSGGANWGGMQWQEGSECGALSEAGESLLADLMGDSGGESGDEGRSAGRKSSIAWAYVSGTSAPDEAPRDRRTDLPIPLERRHAGREERDRRTSGDHFASFCSSTSEARFDADTGAVHYQPPN